MPPGKEQPPPSAGGRQALPERAPCTNGVAAPASAPGVSRLPHPGARPPPAPHPRSRPQEADLVPRLLPPRLPSEPA